MQLKTKVNLFIIISILMLINMRAIVFSADAANYPVRPEEVLKKYFFFVNKDDACSATQYLMPETLEYQKKILIKSFDSTHAESNISVSDTLELKNSWQAVKLFEPAQFICAVFKSTPIQEDVGLRFSHYDVSYISKNEVKIKYDFQYVGPNGRDQETAQPASSQQEILYLVNGKWLIKLHEY